MVTKTKSMLIIIISIVSAVVIIIGGVFAYNTFFAKSKEAKPQEQHNEKGIEDNNMEKVTKSFRFGSANPVLISTEKYGMIELKYMGEVTFDVIEESKYNDVVEEELKEMIIINVNNVMLKYAAEDENFVTRYMQYYKNIIDDSVEALKPNYEKYYIDNLEFSSYQISYTEASVKIINEVKRSNLKDTSNDLTSETSIYNLSVKINLLSKEEGGRHTPAFENAIWQYKFNNSVCKASITRTNGKDMLFPGESYDVEIKTEDCKEKISVGDNFEILENDKTIGTGSVLNIK